MSIGLGETAHAQNKIDDSRAKMEKGANIQPSVDYGIAFYLICAERYSYLLLHDGYNVNDNSSAVWLKRLPEYDKDLGAPKGPAIKDANSYSREFEYASVYLNIENKVGRIVWKKK